MQHERTPLDGSKNPEHPDARLRWDLTWACPHSNRALVREYPPRVMMIIHTDINCPPWTPTIVRYYRGTTILIESPKILLIVHTLHTSMHRYLRRRYSLQRELTKRQSHCCMSSAHPMRVTAVAAPKGKGRFSRIRVHRGVRDRTRLE